MNASHIDSSMKRYIDNNELSCAALIVRKGDDIVYMSKWGLADIDKKLPLEYDSIFRIMSMTKCVVAAGVMILIERGLVKLDDPLDAFLPEFSNMRVCADKRYTYHEGMSKLGLLLKLPCFDMRKVKTVPSERCISIRDLLSHSSGLEMGITGLLSIMKYKQTRQSLKQLQTIYSSYVLDFQPGCGTGYSPMASFDMLARVIEVVTGKGADEFLRDEIFTPLNMTNTAFSLTAEQQKRLVRLYKRKNKKLIDVTNTKHDIDGMLKLGNDYIAGCGGLYSTLTDYDHFVGMLANDGISGQTRVLAPETVKLMRTEAPALHLEPFPGSVWGLGVNIVVNPQLSGRSVPAGAYGWSGAFGTHFVVNPDDGTSFVLMVNRSDLNGAGSYISKETEKLVFTVCA